MSIQFEGGCGLQVVKKKWRSANVNTSMAFKITPSTSQPNPSNTCCVLINITWLLSLWWEGPKLQFFRQIKSCSGVRRKIELTRFIVKADSGQRKRFQNHSNDRS